MAVDVAHLQLPVQRGRPFAMRRQGACEAVALLGLRGRPADAGAQVCVVLRLLRRERGRIGGTGGFLAPGDLSGRLLALVAPMPDDFWHGTREAHREPLFARAGPQAAGPGALPPRSSAADDVLGAGPSLGARNVYAGAGAREKGGSSVLLLQRLLGGRSEEGVDVVVVLALGGLRFGVLGVVLCEYLGPPAAALRHDLACGFLCRFPRVDHAAARAGWGRRRSLGQLCTQCRVRRMLACLVRGVDGGPPCCQRVGAASLTGCCHMKQRNVDAQCPVPSKQSSGSTWGVWKRMQATTPASVCTTAPLRSLVCIIQGWCPEC